MSKAKLAIVIPAYKKLFLTKALDSICNQTNKDFHVYIGDDASPDDLYDIVSKYQKVVDINYHRFSTNVGGENLVGQWHRCINLTNGEKYIWLFSDDDIMAENCVAEFYRTTETEDFDLYGLILLL